MNSEPNQLVHLFIGGLPQKCTREDLGDYLSRYGKVVDLDLSRDPEEGIHHRGFGFAVLAQVQNTDVLMGGHRIHGKKVEIKPRTNEKIFINNLPWDCTKEMVIDAFDFYKIALAEVFIGNGDNGMELGTGYIRIKITGSRAKDWTPHSLTKLGPILVGSTVIGIDSRYMDRRNPRYPNTSHDHSLKSEDAYHQSGRHESNIRNQGKIIVESKQAKFDRRNLQKSDVRSTTGYTEKPKAQDQPTGQFFQEIAQDEEANFVEEPEPIIEIIPKKRNNKLKSKRPDLKYSNSEQSPRNSAIPSHISELNAEEIIYQTLGVSLNDNNKSYWDSSDDKSSRFLKLSHDNSDTYGDYEQSGHTLQELLDAQETFIHHNTSAYPSDIASGSFLNPSNYHLDDSSSRKLDSQITAETAATAGTKLGLKEKLEMRKRKQQALEKQPEAADSMGAALFSTDDQNKHHLSPFSEVYFPNEMGIFSVRPVPQSAPFYIENQGQSNTNWRDAAKTGKPLALNPQSPPIFPSPQLAPSTSGNWLKDRKLSSDQEPFQPSSSQVPNMSIADPHSVFPSATRKIIFPFYAFPGYG